MPPTIYLIRHGKTQANLENRFAGRLPEPLSSQGRQQLASLAVTLQGYGLTRIIAGPLVRTMESAAIIAKSCQLPVTLASELIDIDLPHWDGLTKDEIRNRFGEEYPTWLTSPATFAVPDCETLAAVQQRAMALLTRLQQGAEEDTILLVTHLIVARCLILGCTGQPMSKFRDIKVENGEVVRLEGGGKQKKD